MQGPNRLLNNSSKFLRQVRQVRQVNKYIREIIQCAKNNPVEQKKSQTKVI